MKQFLTIFLIYSFSVLSAQNNLPEVSFTEAYVLFPGANVNIEYEIQDLEDTEFLVSLWILQVDSINYKELDKALIDGDIGNVSGVGSKFISFYLDEPFVKSVRIVVDDMYEFDVEAVINSVDTNRIKENLAKIQGIRHYQENPQKLEEVRDLIIDHHVLLDRDTITQSVTYNTSNKGQNIFGLQHGVYTQNEEYFIGGHYDGVEEGPGADDNGSAVAGMLEVSEVFKDYNFNKSIRYVSWDFEEQGLIGSTHFVQNLPENLIIPAYLNFEMIGYASDKPNTQELPLGFDFLFPDAYQEIQENDFRGDFLTNVGNSTASLQLMNDFETIASQYVPELSVISVASPGNGSSVPDLLRSDHAPFWFSDIPAIMLTDGANFRNKNYHTPNDVMDSLDFNFMMNNIKASIAYLAEKAEINHHSFAEKDLEDFEIVNTKDTKLSDSFGVSPTNFTDQITITNSVNQYQNYTYQIINYSGQLVMQGQGKSSEEIINLQPLTCGSYLVKVIVDEKYAIFKIVKN